ncbi:MAG: hypothetical protein AAFU80_01155 [Pseudomonadota bacterium]
MTREALHCALLEAHSRGDREALVTLYAHAADEVDTEAEAGFLLTHAYVFALESGDRRATALHARLCALGREA